MCRPLVINRFKKAKMLKQQFFCCCYEKNKDTRKIQKIN